MNPPPKAKARSWKSKNVQGPTRTVDVVQPAASLLTQDAAEAIVEGTLQGKSLASISAASGLNQPAVLRHIRGVKVPEDYPTNEEEWRSDVLSFLRIGIWKGTKRMADTGMEELPSANVPVSVAILIDKHALMSGSPTSLSLTAHVTLKASDLQERLARLKTTLTVGPAPE